MITGKTPAAPEFRTAFSRTARDLGARVQSGLNTAVTGIRSRVDTARAGFQALPLNGRTIGVRLDTAYVHLDTVRAKVQALFRNDDHTNMGPPLLVGNMGMVVRSEFPTSSRPAETVQGIQIAKMDSPGLATGSVPTRESRKLVFEREIGKGGFGRVFLAKIFTGDETVGRRVAIKQLRAEFKGDAATIKRLKEEAELSRRIDHPSVVVIEDVTSVDGSAALVMPYIKGATAEELAKEHGPMPPSIAFGMASTFCDVSHKAYYKVDETTGVPLHLVHRDIKPDNILMDLSGQWRVLDFGTARVAGRDQSITRIYFSDGYTAPERFIEAENDYLASDVFSHGWTLYRMLTGQQVEDLPRNEAKYNSGRDIRLAELKVLLLQMYGNKSPDFIDGVCDLIRKMTLFKHAERISLDDVGHGEDAIKGVLTRLDELNTLYLENYRPKSADREPPRYATVKVQKALEKRITTTEGLPNSFFYTYSQEESYSTDRGSTGEAVSSIGNGQQHDADRDQQPSEQAETLETELPETSENTLRAPDKTGSFVRGGVVLAVGGFAGLVIVVGLAGAGLLAAPYVSEFLSRSSHKDGDAPVVDSPAAAPPSSTPKLSPAMPTPAPVSPQVPPVTGTPPPTPGTPATSGKDTTVRNEKTTTRGTSTTKTTTATDVPVPPTPTDFASPWTVEQPSSSGVSVTPAAGGASTSSGQGSPQPAANATPGKPTSTKVSFKFKYDVMYGALPITNGEKIDLIPGGKLTRNNTDTGQTEIFIIPNVSNGALNLDDKKNWKPED